MDAIVQLVEEGTDSNHDHGAADQRITRNWICIQHPSLNFKGRYVPDYEFDKEKFDQALLVAGRKGFEFWLREATTLVINTEINIQLGEFTIKKNFTRPLDEDMKDNADFKTVFSNKSYYGSGYFARGGGPLLVFAPVGILFQGPVAWS